MVDRSFEYANILYNIKPILSEDYKKISKSNARLHICCFNIQSNEEEEASLYHLKNPKLNRLGEPKIPKFFLMYLLHKYSNNNGEDFMIFPFTKKESHLSVLDTIKQYLTKRMSIENYRIIGYKEKGGDIYFFVNISYTIEFDIGSKGSLTFCLLDEICNKRKFLNNPINHSVFSVFYNNPKLIYLKFKNKILSIPDVGFFGVPKKKIAMVLGLGGNLGMGSGARIFGPHSSLWDFQNSFKTAIWLTSNINSLDNEKRNDVDKYGRFKKFGAIIRYAVFLGRRSWHIMYQNTDPFYKRIKNLEGSLTNLRDMENEMARIQVENKNWPKKYDSLTMAPFKLNNINTIYPGYRAYVLRKNSQQIPLSMYYPDPNQELPLFWDRHYKYNIE